MENLLSVIGYIGTGLVIGAYAPPIWRLWTEQCSAEISERAYALWVLSSALFLGHSITIGDPVFMLTQLVNMIALAIILVLARRFRNQICSAHASQFHVKRVVPLTAQMRQTWNYRYRSSAQASRVLRRTRSAFRTCNRRRRRQYAEKI